MKKRICFIGLSREVVERITEDYYGNIIHHDFIPKIIVNNGQLYVERRNGVGMLAVDKVVFHGIYENDFDFITGLNLWGGACYPNAFAMMNCRLKLPCLARALQYSQFNTPRGFISEKTSLNASNIMVAKWGNWHCGENKEKFQGSWTSGEASVLEPFFEGESVRIVIIGEKYWQIKLEGKDWLKSIHDDNAHFMEINQELLEDTIRVKNGLGMDLIANDYIVGNNGQKHLLEVNHIPNVMRFQELGDAYIEEISRWIRI